MYQSNYSVGIYTLGCKVNQYESEAIAEAFVSNGFCLQSPTKVCDIYIINTCTVTAESDRKARQFIRRAIHKNPKAYVLVTGCFSQIRPQQIATIEGVDYICGNANKLSVVTEAVKLVAQNAKNAVPVVNICAPDAHGFEKMRITKFDRTRAYVKIEDGCESHCTYCIIPKARGKIRSKCPADIIAEITELTQNGCREVVLTGIETASYGKDLDGYTLTDLLEAIDRIPNIGRVRLGSLDPSLIKPAFVERIARLSSLTPHFHLSMQSGSSTVLARMKRKYNVQMALRSIQLLREAFPDVQFTTDIIVGFPGETDEEFAQTIAFVKEAKFLMIHIFPYSKRQGTPAATMNRQIADEVKEKRVKELSQIESEIRKSILQKQRQKEMLVLFETYENGTAIGHTANFFEVVCPCSIDPRTKTFPVRVIDDDGIRCIGKLLL